MLSEQRDVIDKAAQGAPALAWLDPDRTQTRTKRERRVLCVAGADQQFGYFGVRIPGKTLEITQS